jgi:type IV pilus assembly protein PilX
MTPSHSSGRQRGAVLFVALVMLLIITLLAVGSLHQVQLETRIAANQLEEQRLLSAAESALREGESKLAASSSPLDDCSTSASPCYTDKATSTYNTDFSNSNTYTGTDGSTTLLRNGRWYLRYIGNSCVSAGGAANAALSRHPTGCTYYYEINAQAYKGSDGYKACGPDALCVRSTYGLVIK